MRKNDYSIEEMLQIISEFHDREKIIAEYKEMEGIEIITQEDMTNLFGSTYFDIHVYWYPRHMYGNHVYTCLTDYEQYELDNGYDPIIGDYIEQIDFEEYFHWFEEFESLYTLEDNNDTY